MELIGPIQTFFGAQNVEGGGPGVGGHAVFGPDADRGEAVFNGLACSRIDRVRDAFPVDFSLVKVIPRCGQSAACLR